MSQAVRNAGWFRCLPGVIGCLIAGAAVCAAEEPAELTLPLPLGTEQIAAAAPAPASAAAVKPHENQPALLVTHSQGETLLPVVADTWLARGNNKDRGSEPILALRVDRYYQALLKISCDALPADAAVQAAKFRFRINWREKESGGKITFHRMLTDWSENATSERSQGSEGVEWSNLRSGVDFEAAPFATFETAKVATGITTAGGFEQALAKWRGGQWPNYGFVALFSGSALQVNVASRESPAPGAAPAAKVTGLLLGGPRQARLLLRLEPALLRRLLTSGEDLQQASLQLRLRKRPTAAGAKIAVYQVSREFQGELSRLDVERGARPVGAIESDANGVFTLPVQTALLGEALISEAPAWLVTAADAKAELELADATHRDASPRLLVAVRKHAAHDLFGLDVAPTPNVYARVHGDGHFRYGDRRLRLWGVNRHDSPNLSIVDRLHKLGFNAIRLWPAQSPYDKTSVARGEFFTPKPGQASPLDQYDRFVAELKKRGIFVLSPLLHGRSPFHDSLRDGLLAEESFIAGLGGGQADWAAWREAVKSRKLGLEMAMYFDERLAAVLKRHASNILEHVNPYTGKRYAEEEAIAIWQVQNENGFIYKVLENGVKSWPAYFQDKLRARWCEWLTWRYGGQAQLLQAWGKLESGESLKNASIQFAPTLTQRTAYPEARGNDLVRFLVEQVVAFNCDFREHCRRHAPTGVGVNVVPFIFDTQFRPSIPWLATQALAGDTVAISTYEWPLTSFLTASPGMYMLDNHTVAGKATVVYETNSVSTNPYRAEFPYRLAALAGRQDWDAVFFHIFHAPDEDRPGPTADEHYLLQRLPYPRRDHYWTGTHFSADTALNTAILGAGRIFLSGAIAPAPHPALYHVHDAGIYSYQYFNGISQREDTFSRGSLLRFDGGDAAALRVERSPAAQDDPAPVLYEPDRGRMIIDTPTAKAYVGRTGAAAGDSPSTRPVYRFRDGTAVGGFNQEFVAFSLISRDGRPIVGDTASKDMLVSAVFDAANTGFVMDRSAARQSGGFLPPVQHAAAIRDIGRAPVRVDRVSWSVWFPTQLQYGLDGYDFAFRKVLHNGNQSDSVVRNDGVREIFFNILTVGQRGAMAAVPAVSDETPATRPGVATRGSERAAVASALWNPLPQVNWSDDHVTAHQKLREADFLRSRIGEPTADKNGQVAFVIEDAELLFGAPAWIEIFFERGQMSQIIVTFTRPPALSEVVAAYQKQFGEPVEKRITTNAFETSVVRWAVNANTREKLEIDLTESQGTMGIVYRRKSGS